MNIKEILQWNEIKRSAIINGFEDPWKYVKKLREDLGEYDHKSTEDLIIENPSEELDDFDEGQLKKLKDMFKYEVKGKRFTWKDIELVSKHILPSNWNGDIIGHEHIFRLKTGELVKIRATINRSGTCSDMSVCQQEYVKVCETCNQEVKS